jgi:hypothetical protein
MQKFRGTLFSVSLLVSAVALSLGLLVAVRAEPARPSRTVEQRVAELEAKVKMLELKLQMVQSTLDRTPRLGVQPAEKR